MNFLQQLIVDEQNFHLERVNKELELVASTDALTGIANRRCFDVIISREWKIAIRNNTQVSLLMIDVDKFKVYNDTYGHQQGDQCLAMVADVLQSAGKRPSDCIARYGGEEFVVLLPGIGLDSAKKIAEQIRLTVEKTRLLNGSVDKGGVTVSIGVATLCPRAGEPLENLIKEADRNLYKAKGIGRNQVIC
ncbi:MAG: GGDEF domain-containing protein [Pseudomonadales bacterium]|nr:GGDEF domain-containing protein [Pseudomonadales bacterium]